MITENGNALSEYKFQKRVRAILKNDPVMDGSGHLHLHPQYKRQLDDEAVAAVQDRTIAALRAQGIEGFDEDKAKAFISIVLRYISFPNRGAKEKTPKPKPKPKPKKSKATKPQSKHPKRRREEVRVIQVTVKKARNNWG